MNILIYNYPQPRLRIVLYILRNRNNGSQKTHSKSTTSFYSEQQSTFRIERKWTFSFYSYSYK